MSDVPFMDRLEPVATPRVSPMPKPVLACRPMVDGDIDPAVALLSEGFPERTPAYWRRALYRMRDRSVPQGRPRYGYVMTDRKRLVGIILVIFSETDSGTIRGNLSSWYVEEAYRGLSHLLIAMPLKLKDVTLVNISPAPTTLETIQAQGFSKYVAGTFHAVTAIDAPVKGTRIRRIQAGDRDTLPVLADHANWGCLCFEISHGSETYPFVFGVGRFVGEKLPCAQLLYCRSLEEFVRFAGPIGRRLLRHGLPAVMLDATGPLPELKGTYRPGRGLRFFNGAEPPRIGDLSYTELAIFGP